MKPGTAKSITDAQFRIARLYPCLLLVARARDRRRSSCGRISATRVASDGCPVGPGLSKFEIKVAMRKVAAMPGVYTSGVTTNLGAPRPRNLRCHSQRRDRDVGDPAGTAHRASFK